MDFEISEFQVELADGIRRLCAGEFGLDAVRSAESTDRVVDRAGWRRLGDAGVFHLCGRKNREFAPGLRECRGRP